MDIIKAKLAIIRAIVGPPRPWPTGQERIHTLRAALLWRFSSLPGLDASVRPDGSVGVFRMR